jgi:maltokinase
MSQLYDELSDHLLNWLPQQRWFATDGREIALVRIISATTLRAAEPAVDLVILGVEFAAGGDAAYYQLLVGQRPAAPGESHEGVIGILDDRVVYDGLAEKNVMEWLLKELANGGGRGAVRFVREPDAQVPREAVGHLFSEAKGKTSIAYGDECVLKWFRQILPSANFDLKVHRALGRARSERVAQLRAAIEVDWNGRPVTAGMLQDFVHNPAEGWAMALVSVRDLLAEGDLAANEVGGDFAGEAFRLGEAVAEVHADLASALDTGEQDPGEVAEAMNARLSAAELAVPALSEFTGNIRAAYAELGGLNKALPTQQIHGDLHLHNVLRTPTGWLLVDFGNEALRSADDQVRPDSILHDVADMLRSFERAARSQLFNWSQTVQGAWQLARRAEEWSARNRSAFCDGYTNFAGTDPREHFAALLAYELDGVVYDSVYSAQDSPETLSALLNSNSISRLAKSLRRES